MKYDSGRIWINGARTLYTLASSRIALSLGKLEKRIAEIKPPEPTWRIIRFARVVDPKKYPHPISTENFITPGELKANLKFVRERFTCLPISEVIKKLSAGKEPERGTVCLTFDGGWIEHLNLVAPLLKELELPAAFFIPTGFVGTNELFWQDKVLVILQIIKLSGRSLPMLSALTAEQQEKMLQLGDGITIEKIFFILEILKQLDPLARMVSLNEISQAAAGLREIPIDRHFMTWDEIRYLAKDKMFEFGSLTQSHYDTTELIREELIEEIYRSFSSLRENQIEPLQILAIPYGQYTPENVSWFNAAGIPTVVSYSMKGMTGKSGSTLLLDRVNFKQMDQKTFWCRVWGV